MVSVEMNLRELKALEIAARAKITWTGECWLVPSQTDNTKYKVMIGDKPSCTCEDFQLRAECCKHVLAARIVAERDGRQGAVPTVEIDDELPKRKTYGQNWSAYTRAQITEKARVRVLLADLVRDIPELPHKGGRFKIPIADALFGVVYKVYTTVSARRFGTDLHEAHELGFVSRKLHPVKVSQYMDNEELTPILTALVARSAYPLRLVETTFAIDSTGFGSSKFHRWFDEKYGRERSEHAWLKLHAVVGTKTNAIVAAQVMEKDSADCPQFKPLLEKAAQNFKIGDMTADKAYLSFDNLDLVDAMGGTPLIPFKSNSTPGEPGSLWSRMYGYFTYRREEFLRRYHARSNVESSFSAVKRLFGDSVRSKSDTAMKNEILCKLIAYNLTVVIHEQEELGIEAEFWKDAPMPEKPNVLRFPALA